jgi:type IV secretion system protein VirB2
MKNSMKQNNFVNKAGAAWSDVQKAMIVALFAVMPASAWAQDAIGENGAVCKFFSNINNILNIASIAVVTIAVIFAGYQIAFAHKRISDVAPVLVGGLLIGGAAQFAKRLMPNQSDQCLGDMAMLIQSLQPIYA